jgi:hypothetical protein
MRQKKYLTDYPHLMKEWSPKNTVDPATITHGSKYKRWWVCAEGHEWETQISSRTVSGSKCPHCYSECRSEINRKAHTNITLWDKREEFPLLIQEYSSENSIPMTEIAYGSSRQKVRWKCATCKHEWEARVNCRTRGRNSCPNCFKKTFAERVRKGRTSITLWDKREEFTHIIQEYSSSNEIPLTEIAWSSMKKVKWVCSTCTCEWEAALNARTKRVGTGCPFCYSKSRAEKTRKGRTKVTLWDRRKDFPLLISDYSPNNEIPLREIAWSSDRKTEWKCSLCYYTWRAFVKDRAQKGSGCPRCCESRLEKATAAVLDKYSIPYERELLLPRNAQSSRNNLWLDFFVEYYEWSIGIECQGIQHYVPCDFGNKTISAEEQVENTQRRDAQKRKHLTALNIPLIEIPYNVENLEEYLLQQLDDVTTQLNERRV